jgi:phosphatidylglycerophosphate synthase
MTRSSWPNLLSGVRAVLAPGLIVAALAGSRPAFAGLVVVSLATDALDGFLARRLNAESELGRKLDSGADYLTLIAGIAGIALLWPEIMHRELPWVILGLVAFFAVVLYGLVRLGRAPCYHTWTTKLSAVALALSLVPLLSGHTPLPFHLAMSLQALGAVEELAIAALIPWYHGEMASVWHAWRLRRERTRH